MTRTAATLILFCLIATSLACNRRHEAADQKSLGEPSGQESLTAEITAIPARHLDRIVGLFNRGVGLIDRKSVV